MPAPHALCFSFLVPLSALCLSPFISFLFWLGAISLFSSPPLQALNIPAVSFVYSFSLPCQPSLPAASPHRVFASPRSFCFCWWWLTNAVSAHLLGVGC
ncbi:hypothetical protein K438DRAFT_445678 [Mycena galopus ATCC 62051]|nr:hypothetical protein K438DRAFT_445678 [Mycena galopus ATCC 62051]